MRLLGHRHAEASVLWLSARGSRATFWNETAHAGWTVVPLLVIRRGNEIGVGSWRYDSVDLADSGKI
jgi:hypothetical protein